MWSLSVALQAFVIGESVVVRDEAPALKQTTRSCLKKELEPTVHVVKTTRDKWPKGKHKAFASHYNEHDGPCWDNVTMLKLQMILDETEEGANQTEKIMQGHYKNITRCWEPVFVNRDREATNQNTALYKHKDSNVCAFAWSGVIGGKREKGKTVSGFFSKKMKDFCGYTVPNSWVETMTAHTDTPGFKKLMEYAASPMCSGGVKLTGFSRGSCFATLLTACAMEGKLQELNPDFPPRFPVDSLWNYGSPGTSIYQPIYNKSDPNGCIRGQRVIVGDMKLNQLSGHLDYAPFAGNLAKFFPGSFGHDLQHAATDLVEMVDIRGGYELRTYPCAACATSTRPSGMGALVTANGLHGIHLENTIEHDSYEYIDFLDEMHGLPRPLPQEFPNDAPEHGARLDDEEEVKLAS